MAKRNKTSIEVQLESANGPRVVVTGDVGAEEILDSLPRGWTVHDDDWSNGVKLSTGAIAYPLSREPGRPAESADGEPRDVVIKVRVSAAEKARLEEIAGEDGISELVRGRLLPSHAVIDAPGHYGSHATVWFVGTEKQCRAWAKREKNVTIIEREGLAIGDKVLGKDAERYAARVS